MQMHEFDAETIRLMEESEKLPDIIGPGTYHQIRDWEARHRFFPNERITPWIWRPYYIAQERADEKYKRFKTVWLQDCDPSYNTNHNYDPPENIYDCMRKIDVIDGDWYEEHDCPKYKDEQRDHTTLPPLV